jgi:hypothetical protein
VAAAPDLRPWPRWGASIRVTLAFHPIDRGGIGLRLTYHLLFPQDDPLADFVVDF